MLAINVTNLRRYQNLFTNESVYTWFHEDNNQKAVECCGSDEPSPWEREFSKDLKQSLLQQDVRKYTNWFSIRVCFIVWIMFSFIFPLDPAIWGGCPGRASFLHKLIFNIWLCGIHNPRDIILHTQEKKIPFIPENISFSKYDVIPQELWKSFFKTTDHLCFL
jgi:hypothetical protein